MDGLVDDGFIVLGGPPRRRAPGRPRGGGRVGGGGPGHPRARSVERDAPAHRRGRAVDDPARRAARRVGRTHRALHQVRDLRGRRPRPRAAAAAGRARPRAARRSRVASCRPPRVLARRASQLAGAAQRAPTPGRSHERTAAGVLVSADPDATTRTRTMTPTAATPTARPTLQDRVDDLPWDELREQLDDRGFAVTDRCCAPPRRGSSRTCSTAAPSARRSTWPAIASATGATATSTTRCPRRSPSCATASTATSRRSPTAGPELLGGDTPTFPLEHEELLARCRAAGQERPTPLILRYGAGDWNALHQDLYGDVFFPFQVLTVLPSRADYEGGEFVLMEQRPRAQSRAHVITAAARRVRDLPDPGAPEPGASRLPPGRAAPRRQHGHPRAAHGARDHLPRQPLTAQEARGERVRHVGRAGRDASCAPSTAPRRAGAPGRDRRSA